MNEDIAYDIYYNFNKYRNTSKESIRDRVQKLRRLRDENHNSIIEHLNNNHNNSNKNIIIEQEEKQSLYTNKAYQEINDNIVCQIESITNDNEDEDESVDDNDDNCTVCGVGGHLFCCDFCIKSYHSECIIKCGSNIPNLNIEEEWQCPSCINNGVTYSKDIIDYDSSDGEIEYNPRTLTNHQLLPHCIECEQEIDSHTWRTGCSQRNEVDEEKMKCNIFNHRKCMLPDLNDKAKMYCCKHFAEKYSSEYINNANELQVLRIFSNRNPNVFYFKYKTANENKYYIKSGTQNLSADELTLVEKFQNHLYDGYRMHYDSPQYVTCSFPYIQTQKSQNINKELKLILYKMSVDPIPFGSCENFADKPTWSLLKKNWNKLLDKFGMV